jgi:hypothetical protein
MLSHSYLANSRPSIIFDAVLRTVPGLQPWMVTVLVPVAGLVSEK